jgi:YrbI family 3-deoxy-D-manno-octulosonate 8-phosphate phosphatase
MCEIYLLASFASWTASAGQQGKPTRFNTGTSGRSSPINKTSSQIRFFSARYFSKKAAFLEKYLAEKNLTWEEVLFMGDDLPDVPVLKRVGLPCCPADAVQEAKEASKYISHINGGYGCVRDVIEKVLRLNNHWQYETDITSK